MITRDNYGIGRKELIWIPTQRNLIGRLKNEGCRQPGWVPKKKVLQSRKKKGIPCGFKFLEHVGGVSRLMISGIPNSQMQEVKPSLGLGIRVSGLLSALTGREGLQNHNMDMLSLPTLQVSRLISERLILQLEDLN